MITSPLLTTFPNILHSFGSKEDPPPLGPLVTMQQVHGVRLRWVDQSINQVCEGFDGLLTAKPGVSLGVKTADCVPILLFEPRKRLIAGIHSGWKGSLKKIVTQVLHELQVCGADPEEIRAAIGPCIRDCCFAVEHDVAGPFQKHFSRWREFLTAHPADKKKWTLDLQECNQIQLREAGVLPEHIDVISLCTSCREDLFYSVRRDGDETGRMISYIRLR